MKIFFTKKSSTNEIYVFSITDYFRNAPSILDNNFVRASLKAKLTNCSSRTDPCVGWPSHNKDPHDLRLPYYCTISERDQPIALQCTDLM